MSECRSRSGLLAKLIAGLVMIAPAWAQMPAGAISGLITDGQKKAVSEASVLITHKETGRSRCVTTGLSGEFSAASMLPGNYEVIVEARGFQRLVREVAVQIGRTTKADFELAVGSVEETITVDGTGPQIRYDTHEVAGVVTRSQVENLPLNARSVLELAKLEPGAQMPSRGTDNLIFVPILGAPTGVNGRSTRITVDGGSIMHVGRGGTPLNISQEAVQEFQVAAANFDLATGATAGGAINMVTRSGSNEWHGSFIFFSREKWLGAFPGLSRTSSDRAPTYQRRQVGFAAGGPLRQDRVFLFATYERSQQDGLISTNFVSPDFAPLSRNTSSPANSDLFSLRSDFRVHPSHTVFLRYSHEDGSSFGTATSNQAMVLRGYPSSWGRARAWVDQIILGVTSQLGTQAVNELRFSYFFISTTNQPPHDENCPGCLGIGAPSISVRPELFIGFSTSWSVLARRFHLHDTLSWQRETHQVRFGGDWETTRGGRTDQLDEPVSMVLFPPQTVRLFNSLPSTPPQLVIPLPSSFLTLQNILQLPVQSFSVGIGDPRVRQENSGYVRIVPFIRLFVHDTWRVRPRLTVNFGLSWSHEAPFNYDLQKPLYLAPILGADELRPSTGNWRDFAPSLGFAWSLRADGKTVLRGGAGRYYNSQPNYSHADRERTSLGPGGTGRSVYGSAGILNPLSGIPGVPQGTALFFSVPSLFTGESLLTALPAIRAALALLRGDPSHPGASFANIEVDKQGLLIARNFPTPAATHFSLGVQQELMRDFVLTADFVVRRFSGLAAQPDRNRFFSAAGPVLPMCTQAQRLDPAALCSVGPIEELRSLGRALYRGLLVRGEKRFSSGWQMLASYALSSNVGHLFDVGFDNDNWLQNYGPLDRDFRHLVNISGTVELPWKIRLGAIATYYSKAPFTPFLGGLDLNGDGTTNDPLPGAGVNQFNRGLGKADLRRLVDQFNLTVAGGRDARGRLIPPITLPGRYAFGDSLLTHDLRVSRPFALRERGRLIFIGEVFNLFNIANLSGYSGDLLSASFGQPGSRVTQVFGSGGPRSFQLAVRVEF